MEEEHSRSAMDSPERKRSAAVGAWATPSHSPSSRGGRRTRGSRTATREEEEKTGEIVKMSGTLEEGYQEEEDAFGLSQDRDEGDEGGMAEDQMEEEEGGDPSLLQSLLVEKKQR